MPGARWWLAVAGAALLGAEPARCPPAPACDPPLALLGPPGPWRHPATALFASPEQARHRGRDLVLHAGQPQWVIARFAYGPQEQALSDELVEVYLQRGCTWEPLGEAITTDPAAPRGAVAGVRDEGGMVYFAIPEGRRLSPGEHRLRLVVRGDHTAADVRLVVLAGGERWVVSDVDGTLTESEAAEFRSLATGGPTPAAHPGAAEALAALAGRGYHVVYLTGRAAWLTEPTRRWLAEKGFPPGVLRTRSGAISLGGESVRAYKAAALAEIGARFGRPPDAAFGNKPTDLSAYRSTGMPAGRIWLYRPGFAADGARPFTDYRALSPELAGLPAACPASGASQPAQGASGTPRPE